MTIPSVPDSQSPFPKGRPNPKQKRMFRDGERRESRRFALRLPLRYRAEGQSGTGEVLNISSRGVLFTLDQDQLPPGLVELFISWPVLLDEAVALNLVAAGPVVRAEKGKAAVRINRYEFRPARTPNRKCETPLATPRVQASAGTAGAFSFA